MGAPICIDSWYYSTKLWAAASTRYSLGWISFPSERFFRLNSRLKYSMVLWRPARSETLGSQFKTFLARLMSGLRRRGSSSTSGLWTILLSLPTSSRIMRAKSENKTKRIYFLSPSQSNLELQCTLILRTSFSWTLLCTPEQSWFLINFSFHHCKRSIALPPSKFLLESKT